VFVNKNRRSFSSWSQDLITAKKANYFSIVSPLQ